LEVVTSHAETEIKPPMTLRKNGDGEPFLALGTKYGSLQFHPYGPPGDQGFTKGGRQVLKYVPSEEVKFINHQFKTTDRNLARALVDSVHFGGVDAYHLDSACLPEELTEFFHRLPIKTQRRLLIKLIDGVSADDVFDQIDQAELDTATQTLGGSGTYEIRCPHEGCGIMIGAEGEGAVRKAQAAVVEHVNVMHSGKI
jgi:hypothetical protein